MRAVETFVTVLVILAMIAFGAYLIRRLNSQHGERTAGFHYGHSGMPLGGPTPSAPRKGRGRGRVGTGSVGRRRDHRDGGRGRLRTRRHIRHGAG